MSDICANAAFVAISCSFASLIGVFGAVGYGCPWLIMPYSVSACVSGVAAYIFGKLGGVFDGAL